MLVLPNKLLKVRQEHTKKSAGKICYLTSRERLAMRGKFLTQTANHDLSLNFGL